MNEKYLDAVKTIKTAILRSQCRMAKQGNTELLSLYYGIGGYVSGNSRKGTWGTGAIDEISSRLREEMPGLRGFSAANIKFMRQFYEAWQPYLQNNLDNAADVKSLTMVSDLEQIENNQLKISRNRLPLFSELPICIFGTGRCTWTRVRLIFMNGMFLIVMMAMGIGSPSRKRHWSC